METKQKDKSGNDQMMGSDHCSHVYTGCSDQSLPCKRTDELEPKLDTFYFESIFAQNTINEPHGSPTVTSSFIIMNVGIAFHFPPALTVPRL